MTVPVVVITKIDGQTGVPLAPDPRGVLALIAPCQQGALLTPANITKPANALTTYGYGMATSYLYYHLPVVKKQVLYTRQSTTVAPVTGTFTYTGTGLLSGSITQTGTPLDDFQGMVQFVVGGTTGITGITYQTSIDGRAFGDPAKVWSAVQALGVGLTITVPNTGITYTLVTAKTVVAGDWFVVNITGPRFNDADVSAALTALGNSGQPWEMLLVLGIDATTTTLSNIDTFLAGLESSGKYKGFIVNARLRAQDGSETEAQYLTALTTLYSGSASIRGDLTADGSYFTDPLRGIDVVRSTAWGFVPRLMSQGVTIDAAQVDLGPIPNVRITDANGNAKYHDEQLNPGLDDQRMVTYRTFNNKVGVFINNPKVISTPGSDYFFAQQIRTMNRAYELAFGPLTDKLSKGGFKDPVTARIREDSAQDIESAVNNPIVEELGKSVVFINFTLSRDDDVSSNAGATLTGTINLIMPFYIKGFQVNARFQRTVSAST